jgi:hypothetical protein
MNTMDKSTQNNSKNAENVQTEVHALNKSVKAIDLANRSFKEIFYGKRINLDSDISIESSDSKTETMLRYANHDSLNTESLQTRHSPQETSEKTRPLEQNHETDTTNGTSEHVAAKSSDSRWKKAS